MWPGPYGEWGSRKYLLASLDQSLQRMGLDYVDIFYSHRFDPDTPLEETMGALDTAVRQGKALYVGISSYSAERTARGGARSCAARHAAADPPAVLLDVQPLDRARAARRAASEEGIGCIAFSPLGQGLLTDRYLNGMPEDSRAAKDGFLKRDFISEENLARVRALNEIAQRRGQTLAQMALAWVLRDPRVTSALIGASNVAQLEDERRGARQPRVLRRGTGRDRPVRRRGRHQHLAAIQRCLKATDSSSSTTTPSTTW